MVVKSLILEMLPNIWPMLLFITVVCVSLRLSYLIKGSRKIIIYKELFSLVFILYIVCLYYILTYRVIGVAGVNFIPFKEIFRYQFGSYKFIKNIVGNIILFIPFGFFTSHYLNSRKIGRVIPVVIIVSITAEAMQYYLGRVFDIDDVILNVLGGFLGYLLYKILNIIKEHLPSFMQSDAFINFVVIIIFVLITLYYMGINIFAI